MGAGMAAGVKARSREAVRLRAQGLTRDDSPGEDECGWNHRRQIRPPTCPWKPVRFKIQPEHALERPRTGASEHAAEINFGGKDFEIVRAGLGIVLPVAVDQGLVLLTEVD